MVEIWILKTISIFFKRHGVTIMAFQGIYSMSHHDITLSVFNSLQIRNEIIDKSFVYKTLNIK